HDADRDRRVVLRADLPLRLPAHQSGDHTAAPLRAALAKYRNRIPVGRVHNHRDPVAIIRWTFRRAFGHRWRTAARADRPARLGRPHPSRRDLRLLHPELLPGGALRLQLPPARSVHRADRAPVPTHGATARRPGFFMLGCVDRLDPRSHAGDCAVGGPGRARLITLSHHRQVYYRTGRSHAEVTMRIAHKVGVALVAIALLLLLLMLPRRGHTQSTQDAGDYIVHYSAITTQQLPADAATQYGITRAGNRGLLNVAGEAKHGDASMVRAKVSATVSDLTGHAQ